MRFRCALLAAAAALALLAPAAARAAVYDVSNTNDVAASNPSSGSCATPPLSAAAGACTLRSAVQAANHVSGPSTISVSPGTYKLTIAPSGPDDDSTGDLNVTNTSGKITIDGAGSGPSGTIVDGNFTDRVFDTATSTDVEIDGVRIRNGRPGSLGNTTTCPSPGVPFADGGGIQTLGALTLKNDVLTGNMASGHGGGVFIDGNGSISVAGTTLSGNIACPPGSEGGFNSGGGISHFGSGTLTIDTSTFSGNSAASFGVGGGLAVESEGGGDVTVTNTTFSNNDAGTGGGADTESDTIFKFFADTFTGNTARSAGAALNNSGGTDSVVNSTITDNHGSGGITSGIGQTTFSFSTITRNEGNIVNRDSGQFVLEDSIVADPTNGGSNCNGPGGFTSNGNNLFDDDGTGCNAISSDLKSKNPLLGPLQGNGGPTQTRALLTGSPAIDAADDTACADVAKSVDQRGVTRPQGPHCDIGAYEYQDADLALTASAKKSTIDVGQQDTVTDVVTNNGPSTATGVVFTDPAPAGFTILSVTTTHGTCTHTAKTVHCNLGTIPTGGKVTIRIVLRGNSPGVITLKSKVSASQPDPKPGNNNATVRITVVAPKHGCVDQRSFVFRFQRDPDDRGNQDDRVILVKVYVNGNLVETHHGHDIRKVEIKHFSKHGFHFVLVAGRRVDGRLVELRRTYHGCTNGPTHSHTEEPGDQGVGSSR
jgi:uncharacterized repeat protein (TIGR01451 family)